MVNLELFSPLEQKVLKYLYASRKPKSLIQIADKLYGDKELKVTPMYASSTISTTVQRINGKCDRHKLKWFLNGVGGGRGGRMVWIDDRE